MKEENPFILNRNAPNQTQLEEKLEKEMEDVRTMATNQALASQFPDWDLKPPSVLIRRKKGRIL